MSLEKVIKVLGRLVARSKEYEEDEGITPYLYTTVTPEEHLLIEGYQRFSTFWEDFTKLDIETHTDKEIISYISFLQNRNDIIINYADYIDDYTENTGNYKYIEVLTDIKVFTLKKSGVLEFYCIETTNKNAFTKVITEYNLEVTNGNAGFGIYVYDVTDKQRLMVFLEDLFDSWSREYEESNPFLIRGSYIGDYYEVTHHTLYRDILIKKVTTTNTVILEKEGVTRDDVEVLIDTLYVEAKHFNYTRGNH